MSTDFTPTRNGLHFSNSFVNPVITIPGVGTINTYGLCGGMSFASLDYYHPQLPIPTHTPATYLDLRLSSGISTNPAASATLGDVVELGFTVSNDGDYAAHLQALDASVIGPLGDDLDALFTSAARRRTLLPAAASRTSLRTTASERTREPTSSSRGTSPASASGSRCRRAPREPQLPPCSTPVERSRVRKLRTVVLTVSPSF
jgi:hypothetical protein